MERQRDDEVADRRKPDKMTRKKSSHGQPRIIAALQKFHAADEHGLTIAFIRRSSHFSDRNAPLLHEATPVH
ncbi:hypothetical protein K1W69_20065 [Hoeflea sp. WL0058]|uniref:Uncharacterized protein n=1 Tax=Flavimaribacter sediminis TaxID=2865987 RepID=A0AAE3D1B3_9HYPH|nr:hypothetical protein [Flavimaribacter sediminis]MBW8639500.1 hypothetical protein [Flavimaribacter sediminis]